ncbi:MAG: cupin [Acidimicrobiia bacterium]|nr:cupin [Acidimicrobiia bacterium]
MSLHTADTPINAEQALVRAVGDPDVFAEKLWRQRPQHRRSSDTRGFADLLSLDDVDLIVSTTGLRLPAFRLVRDGTTLPSASYTKATRTGTQTSAGVIDARRVFDEFADGATLVFQSMHRYWAPLADYCRGLELALGHPVQANAYITPPGAQGFDAHEDEHDVIVLQSHGTKGWMVHDRHDLPPSRPPLIDGLLSPGDSLYIPAGFPHSASTQEQASVHITIGILSVTWATAVREALKVVESDPAFDEPLPLRFSVDDDTLAEVVRGRLDLIGSAVAKIDPQAMARTLRRKVLTTRQPLLRGQIHRLLALDEVKDESVVKRRPGSICVIETIDDELSVLLGDRELRMPGWLEPAMTLLAGGKRAVIADLPGLDEASRLVLVRRLIREGLLEVVV